MLTLRDSKDEKVRKAGIQVLIGRRLSSSRAVVDAESSLWQKDTIGTISVGRQDLSMAPPPSWSRPDVEKQRKQVQRGLTSIEEETRRGNCLGAWVNWSTAEQKMGWQDNWQYQVLENCPS